MASGSCLRVGVSRGSDPAFLAASEALLRGLAEGSVPAPDLRALGHMKALLLLQEPGALRRALQVFEEHSTLPPGRPPGGHPTGQEWGWGWGWGQGPSSGGNAPCGRLRVCAPFHPLQWRENSVLLPFRPPAHGRSSVGVWEEGVPVAVVLRPPGPGPIRAVRPAGSKWETGIRRSDPAGVLERCQRQGLDWGVTEGEVLRRGKGPL